MFVLHPSSRCDVCLEGFSWEIEMAPYAIPCGHVFCKTCLESVVPPKCPMCRKNFDPARLKKLHVDRPEGEEDPREGDLLQRIAMAFDAPEEHRRDLLVEVDAWLGEQHADAAQPLRKARASIDKYQELREMGIQGKREITILKQEMRDKAAIMEVEKERATAIENNLLERARELQAQTLAAQGEIDHLRAEVQRRTQLKNPLPPPPQPISFDRYAGFGPTDTSGLRTSWYNDSGRSMLLPSRGPVPNGGSYVHPRNIYPEDDRENQAHVLNESNGARRDRKGKGRGVPDATSEVVHPVYGPAPPLYLPPPTPHPISDSSKPKAGIIPGASPKSKFIPPDPEAEMRERGFHAFKPPDPVPSATQEPAEPAPKWFDPARDAVDPWTLVASALPQYANGFAEGYTSGLQAVQNAIPSGSRIKESDPDVGASDSDREKQERRARRRREREKKEAERNRERDPGDRERREHRSRRERERDGEQPSMSNRNTGDAAQEAVSSRPRRGDDLHTSRPRTHRRDTVDINGQQHEQASAMPNDGLGSPHRRRSVSRPRTAGAIPHQPPIPPVAQTPLQPAPQPPNPVVQHIAQPTPRIPIQQQLEALDHSAELMQTPGSRRSIQSDGTADSWGTVSSLPQPSPNSLSSLNLRSFSRQPTIPLNAPPFRSPTIPVIPQADPEPESTDEDTETERVIPDMAVSARENHSSRPRRRNQERSHTTGSNRNSSEQYWPPPHSAPVPALALGTRHTQALAIPEHYQNPTLAYQHPPPIQSASAAIPESNPSRQRRDSRSSRQQQSQHQHRSRHSASQAHPSGVNHATNSNGAVIPNARTRRVSFTAAPPSVTNGSMSSLSLHSPPGQADHYSANDHDVGYHTDVPYSGNALGLAISALDRDHTVRSRGLQITAPTPIVSNLNFLRSFSHDNYPQ